jgi:hypothetical protein
VLPLRPFRSVLPGVLDRAAAREHPDAAPPAAGRLSPQLPHAIVQAHLADAGGPARVVVVLAEGLRRFTGADDRDAAWRGSCGSFVAVIVRLLGPRSVVAPTVESGWVTRKVQFPLSNSPALPNLPVLKIKTALTCASLRPWGGPGRRAPVSAQYPHRQRWPCFSRGRCGCGSAIHLCQILFKRTCGVVTLPGVIPARSQHPRRIAAAPACRQSVRVRDGFPESAGQAPGRRGTAGPDL